MHNLIQIGALQVFGSCRDLMVQLAVNSQHKSNQPLGQCVLPLAATPDTTMQPTNPQDKPAAIFTELELTGLYISGHPLEQFRPLLASYEAITSSQLRHCSDGYKARVAGIIVSRQMPPTKSKQRVIFLTIEDERGLIDITVLPHAQETYAKAALGCALLLVEGTVRKTGPESISVTAERLFDLRRLGKRRVGRI